MAVDFTVTEKSVTVPQDSHHTPCGLDLPDHAAVVEHRETCVHCRCFYAIRGRW